MGKSEYYSNVVDPNLIFEVIYYVKLSLNNFSVNSSLDVISMNYIKIASVKDLQQNVLLVFSSDKLVNCGFYFTTQTYEKKISINLDIYPTINAVDYSKNGFLMGGCHTNIVTNIPKAILIFVSSNYQIKYNIPSTSNNDSCISSILWKEDWNFLFSMYSSNTGIEKQCSLYTTKLPDFLSSNFDEFTIL